MRFYQPPRHQTNTFTIREHGLRRSFFAWSPYPPRANLAAFFVARNLEGGVIELNIAIVLLFGQQRSQPHRRHARLA
jgi:hypothetical protein